MRLPDWEARWAGHYTHGPVRIIMAGGRRLRRPRIVRVVVTEAENAPVKDMRRQAAEGGDNAKE